jgi:hypothetical protein
LKEGPTYQYSAEDIQRYLDGKMDPAGMHALEKAALEDPFLADAIEGFREMRPDIKEDIMEMQNKLSEKKQEERKKMDPYRHRIITPSFLWWLVHVQGRWRRPAADREAGRNSTGYPGNDSSRARFHGEQWCR